MNGRESFVVISVILRLEEGINEANERKTEECYGNFS